MLKKRESLSVQLTRELIAKIEDGEYRPGEKIPTEQALSDSYQVSRTVVREAVAALRSDGQVISRQGAGVYVADVKRPKSFEINLSEAEKLQEVLSVLELRRGVEVEAVGLAASRRTDEDLVRLEACYAKVGEEIVKDDGDYVDADFHFHRAIAKATQNPYYIEFLSFLGPFIIPHLWIRHRFASAAQREKYAKKIQAEHWKILTTIQDQDPAAARSAMRRHVSNSIKEYSDSLSELGTAVNRD
ncbi:FadR/GntR family transcriptional regulator [Pelagibius sp. Alg239-R121]|uniref:FadR/GntR family transcriptional regulator n=1 Tax=Pelagibius sp. Alg239-R121 TaxID=2993448 RepID=UPI0024A6459C|nr:FadR/GntR family transcriptional regulator [Pelagibius sp. Alg239-R121]